MKEEKEERNHDKERDNNLYEISKLATVGKMVQYLVHEINNPLAIAKGFSEIMVEELQKRNVLTPALSDMLLKQEQSLSRIGNIIQGMRSLSTIDDSIIEEINLPNFIEEITSTTEDICNKKSIVIEKKYFSKSQVVTSSKGKLGSVLLILIQNAIEAIIDGNKNNSSISILSYDDSNKPGNLMIEICDSGIGIEKCNLEKIFNPFYTSKEGTGNLGIGLTVAQKLLQEMNTELSVSSQIGQGSSFMFSLLASGQQLYCEEQGPVNLKEKAVLIVDDEEEIRSMLVNNLTVQGMVVYSTSSGHSAFEFLQNNQVDYLITDLMMENGNGGELLRNVQSLSCKSSMAIIAITGGMLSGFSKIDRDTIKKYADNILVKPFDSKQLLMSIKEIKK
ncbi:MAG: response regulator [Oligoflexia bacterium]|nr:response regulator [Oligoflexia bacterium]MBF0366764.1 response regulator [Oligoflexia bacterium]